MRSDVQVVVDRLAEVLGRSVSLRGADEDFVTFSSLQGETDERRRQWILTQGEVSRGDGSLREFLRDRPGPLVRTSPGEIEPGSLARVLGVVEDDHGLLGGVSVIDGPTPLTPSEVGLVLGAAEELRVPMRRGLDAAERRSREQTELTGALVGGDPDARRQAVQSIVDLDLLSSLAPCRVVVALLVSHDQQDAVEPARQVLRECLRHAGIRYGSHRSLVGVLQGHGVVLLLGGGPEDDSHQAADRLHQELSNRLAGLSDRRALPGTVSAVVAVSDPEPGIEQAHVAYAQALRLGRVATAVGGFDTVVSSQAVGVYDVLAQLPESALARAILPAGLQRLLDRRGDADVLVSTLECYLDNAGNAVAAAQQLVVHRATLYYRLERIEDITGVELRDGMQRVSLHLGIKLARLAGIIPAAGFRPQPGS